MHTMEEAMPLRILLFTKLASYIIVIVILQMINTA